MMNNKYKLIVSNKNLYKEGDLPPDKEEVRLGTLPGCDIRLQKEEFFEPVELTFSNRDNGWTVFCADNLYLAETPEDLKKNRSKALSHGDKFEVRYLDSDNAVISLEYVIDFDEGNHPFNRYVDCTGLSQISIGSGESHHIMISGPYIARDSIQLIRDAKGFRLHILNSTYGVLHNGKRAAEGEQILDNDFFSISDCYFYLKNNHLWTEKTTRIRFQGLKVYDSVNRGEYPRFHRSSRMQVVLNEDKIPVLDPAQKPQKPKNNLLLRLLPSVGMVLAAILMATISKSPTMLIFSGVSVICAAITAVLTLKQNNREYKEALEKRTETYNSYIANKRAEIEQCRVLEQQTLEEIYIPLERENQYIHQFSPELFDRTKEDADFLCVRLGTGDVPARRELDYKRQEKLEPEDELQQIPEQLQKEYRFVHGAPVVCDFRQQNAVGVIGEEAYRLEILKNMVIDLSARHIAADVSMVFIARENHRSQVRWLRFLPNVWNEALGIRNIVTDDESRAVVFEYLYKEMTLREQNKGFENRIVVFLLDEYGFQAHPISRFVERAKELGIIFVFFGDNKAAIPAGCESLIFVNDAQTGYLVNAHDRNDNLGFFYPTLTMAQAGRIVELLAPVYVDEISLEGDLTKNISLFELLKILAADDLDLLERWKNSNVTKSMAAPIGVTKSGVIELDLHDKAHGPHGLVAGTTGSGKSEILQTFILSMATLFSPYEVGFMIIDFKGGGMVNQFGQLPHLLGSITNIDGKEIDRSLKSIKAELQKRQRLFAEAEVNHIDKYIEKYRAGAVPVPLPHLIIIVDEFAELKAEQPEFMKELISAARIGRSLGVHLILATQKPAGQVNEQIWSNSRFRLCLKVQSQEDSNEVLKSPLAAEIKEAGRAYLQVGNNEIFELFQSAYSGAPEKAGESGEKEFALIELTDSGKRKPVFVRKKKKSSASRTQLDAIVSFVAEFCKERGISRLPEICLPPLPERIAFPEKERLLPKDFACTTEIGIYDDPDRQYQGRYAIDLANQNVMIIGSAQSGKTNVLQAMIRGLAERYTPEEVSVYIIDFASMVLKNFEGLNHVGGVVTSSEDEKLKNLFKMLFTEIGVRKEKMLAVGVSSFTAYKEAGKTDLPQIVLLIDNLSALRELYFQDDDELLRLCREGLSVGISIVVANSQTAGIGYRYLSSFSCRIALFCNDSSEYGSLFEHCRIHPEDIPGRMLVEMDKTHLECQGFLAFEGEKEIDRVNAVSEFIQGVNSENESLKAKAIPVIPELLTAGETAEDFGTLMQEENRIVAGLDYSTVSPVLWNLSALGVLALTGREGMGQHNFIRFLISMQERMHPGKTEVYIVDGLSRRLKDMAELPQVKSYGYLSAQGTEVVKQLAARLQEHYDRLSMGEEEALSDAPLLILILNNPEAMKEISEDMDAMKAYRDITGRLRNMKICVLLGSYENTPVSYSAPEVIKKAKDDSHFLLFDDLQNFKVMDLPLAYSRVFKKPLEPGDCYYIKGSSCRKIKTPLAELR